MFQVSLHEHVERHIAKVKKELGVGEASFDPTAAYLSENPTDPSLADLDDCLVRECELDSDEGREESDEEEDNGVESEDEEDEEETDSERDDGEMNSESDHSFDEEWDIFSE